MSANLVYRPMDSEHERDEVVRVLRICFGGETEQRARWLEDTGYENVRVWHEDGRVAGVMSLIQMGQFFGGRSVPMTGIAAVGVPPEARGRGVATRMMSASLREIHDQHVPLSMLYASKQPLYRRVGYEKAGSRFVLRISPREIALRGDLDTGDLRVRQASERDRVAVEQIFRRHGAIHDGWLDRGPYIWKRVLEPRLGKADGLIVEGDAGPEGYVYWRQELQTTPEWIQRLWVTDIAASTPLAWRRLVRLLAEFGSVVKELVIPCGPTHPLLMLLSENRYTLDLYEHWMLRIVDVAGALSGRGYPAGVTGELHLDVRDELLVENAGRWVLRVDNGTGIAEKGGDGSVSLDICTLASMYTGYLTPMALRGIGLIDGPEEQVRLAGAMFAGEAPACPDAF